MFNEAMQKAIAAQSVRAAELVDDLKAALAGTDRDLIGAQANAKFDKVAELPDLILKQVELENLEEAWWLAEHLVNNVYDWVVDNAKVLPVARELRDTLEEVDPIH